MSRIQGKRSLRRRISPLTRNLFAFAMIRTRCLVVALSAAAALAQPAALSESKLSIHQLTTYTPGAQQIVNAHPRVLKVMGIATGPPLQAVHDYKASTPDGIVVLREYTGHVYSVNEDPAAAAQHFWNTVLAPPLNLLSPADRALIDYVEGPNEGDSTPTWGTAQDTIWYNNFWITLAPLIANAGFKPCAFSISVGNPPGTMSQMLNSISRIVPALRLVKSLGGAWSYHSYTIPYTTDFNTERWYSLRYRFYYDHFAALYPDLLDLPLILTEGGVDGHPGPGGAGWQNAGDAETFKNWLTWYDQQIRQDDYVLGVTLFQSGSPGWASYEIEPIADWLADYLISQPSSPLIAVSPTELTRVVTYGENLPSETIAVWNAANGTLNYAISSNAGWLDVSPAQGSSTGLQNLHTLTYAVSGLDTGDHEATLSIVDAQAGNSPLNLDVTVTVEPIDYPGDFDDDTDVDLADYGQFQCCLRGPGIVQTDPDCGPADLNYDTYVDGSDMILFVDCLSGAGVPANPDCAD